MKIAVIGTGLMGAPMARNLAAAGHAVTVWNRSADKANALADVATVARTPANAVAEAEVVVSMLSDGSATAAILADPDLQGTLAQGTTWIEMASIKPAEARAQARDLAALGVGHLDAPVSGGTAGAEAATLAIMVGGPEETFAAMSPVFAPLGRAVHVGPSGAGQLAKLANQMIVGITIGAVAEAMLLVEDGGGDPDALRAALKGGFADSTILQLHGQRMSSRDFTPGGRVATQAKDLDNALEEAESLGLRLPLTAELRRRFTRLRDDLGAADKDHAALFEELLDLNGRQS